MSVVLRAGTGGGSNTAVTSMVTNLPAGTAIGDLTMIFVECTNADVIYGAATGGWVKLAEHSNILNSNLAGAIYSRVWTTTPAAPTITFADGNNAGGMVSWSAISFSPGAGGTLVVDNATDGGKFFGSGTSFAINAKVANAAEVCSVVFAGQRSNTINSSTIVSSPSTGYTQPTGVSKGTTMTGTTVGTNENIGTNIFYRLAQSGTIAPAAYTVNRDASASDWHFLIAEVTPASVKAVGTIVDGGTAATSITLPVPATAAAGDYLVAVLYNNLGTSASDWAMGSTGFTRIGPAFIASDLGQRVGGLFGQRLAATPPASYTFTTPDASTTRTVGAIIALSNVDPTTPVSASTSWTEASGTATSLSIPGGGNGGDLTLEYITTDFASPNSYGGATNDSGLTSQAVLISPAGTENTGVSRTMVRIYGDIAPASGVPAHTFSTTGSSSHRAAFLVSFKGVLAGAVNLTASADFTGSGALTATTVPRPSTAAALSGAGALGATGAANLTVAASLAGAGALTGTQAPRWTVPTGFAGSGALTASTSVAAPASLTGSGTLAATVIPQWTQSATLTGSGSLAAAATPKGTQAVSLTGAGTLTTAQATGGTTYRMYAGATGPSASDNDASAVSLGVEFYVTSAATLTEIRWWQPTTGASTAARQGALYLISNQSQVATATAAAPSGSGWQTLTFATPVTLTPNTRYRAAVYHPGGLYASTGSYYASGADEVNGPLVIPKNANASAPGQATYNYATGLTYPVSTFQSAIYWVDVTVATTGAFAATASGTLSGSGSLAATLTPRPVGAVAFAGTGALNATPANTTNLTAAAALSASGSLTGTGGKTTAGTAALTGSGALSALVSTGGLGRAVVRRISNGAWVPTTLTRL